MVWEKEGGSQMLPGTSHSSAAVTRHARVLDSDKTVTFARRPHVKSGRSAHEIWTETLSDELSLLRRVDPLNSSPSHPLSLRGATGFPLRSHHLFARRLTCLALRREGVAASTNIVSHACARSPFEIEEVLRGRLRNKAAAVAYCFRASSWWRGRVWVWASECNLAETVLARRCHGRDKTPDYFTSDNPFGIWMNNNNNNLRI